MTSTPGKPRFDPALIPFVALLLLAVVAPLERGLFFPLDQQRFAIVVGAVAVLAAVARLARGGGPARPTLLDAGALALFCGYWIGYLRHPVVPLDALGAAVRAGMVLAWFWAVASTAVGPRRFDALAHVLAATGWILALVGCLAAAGRITFPSAVVQDQILSTLQYHNALGAWLDFGVLLTAALALAGRPHRGSAPPLGRLLRQAGYGAAAVLLLVTLLGTASRGAWVILPVGAVIWMLGLPAAQRREAAFLLLWPVGVGVLFSRPTLDGFWGGHGAAGLATLAVGMLLGAGGYAAYGWAAEAWSRSRRTLGREARWVLQGLGALYAAGVLVFAVLSTGRAAAALAGHGLVDPAVAQRAGTVAPTTPSLLARVVMWRDALSLVRGSPLWGYGGGGWDALYHRVQSGLYWSSQVHDSLLQAWLGGGLLAAAGTAALGIGVLVLGWRLRAPERRAGVPWGLAAAALALWLHALVDFDLSLPAVALLLWAAAGGLRACVTPGWGKAVPAGAAGNPSPTGAPTQAAAPATSIAPGASVAPGAPASGAFGLAATGVAALSAAAPAAAGGGPSTGTAAGPGLPSAAGGLTAPAGSTAVAGRAAIRRLAWLALACAVPACLGITVIVAGGRLLRSTTLGAEAASLMRARQYAAAYGRYTAALSLEPLSGPELADRAQLLLLAYGVNHQASVRQQAADTAQEALQVDPGDLTVDSAVTGMLGAAGRWPQEVQAAEGLVAQFPLDSGVYGDAGQALLNAARGELNAGDFASAGQALSLAAGLPEALQRAYTARADAASRQAYRPPQPDPGLLLSTGEALALQGRWTAAAATLAPLTAPGRAGSAQVADEARTWLSVAQRRAGDPSLAGVTFAPLSRSTAWVGRWDQAYRWTAFSSALPPA